MKKKIKKSEHTDWMREDPTHLLYRVAKGHGDRPAGMLDGGLPRMPQGDINRIGLHPWKDYDVLDLSIPRRNQVYFLNGSMLTINRKKHKQEVIRGTKTRTTKARR